MEEYLSFVVENGGVTWKVKSNIRLLSKVFNITYDKLLFELEGGINSYIKEEKKKGKHLSIVLNVNIMLLLK